MNFLLPPFARSSEPWTPDDAQVVLAAFTRSGLSLAEFSEHHGVHPTRLRRWHIRLGLPDPVAAARSVSRSKTARLVELVARPESTATAPNPVPLAHPSPVARTEPVEVLAPGGWQLRVPGELLAELVSALSRAAC